MDEILNELVGKVIASVESNTTKDEQGDKYATYIKFIFTDGTEATFYPAVWDLGMLLALM